MAGPQYASISRDKADKVAAILRKAAELLHGIDAEGAGIALEVAGYFGHASTLQVAPLDPQPGPPRP